jgi:hypothetical protein
MDFAAGIMSGSDCWPVGMQAVPPMRQFFTRRIWADQSRA